MFENNCLRAILNIRLLDHVSIKEIRKRYKELNPIENVIRKKRLTCFGHVCRMNDESLQKIMMKKDFVKKRKRGRPYKRWLDLIQEDTGFPVATAEKYAKDKKSWRNNVNKRWAKHLLGVCN